MEQKRLFALLSAAVLFMSSLSFPDPVIQAAAAEATDWEKTYNYILSFYEEDADATYDLFDINGDHIPELFLTPDNYMNAETFIYSVKGTEIINLGPVCATTFYGLPDRNQLVCGISEMANGGDTSLNSVIVYELRNWELVPVKTMTEYLRNGTAYQYEIDGKTVSSDSYNAQRSTYMTNPRIRVGHAFLTCAYVLREINAFYKQYDSWQEAYYFFMLQYYYQHSLDSEVQNSTVHFETFDLNGDGTQELVFSTGDFHYADVYIYTFADGYLALAGILAGSWGVIGSSCNQKYIKVFDSHMGIIRNDIYQLIGKKINKVISFEDSHDAAVDSKSDYYKGYRINDTAVSLDEYEQKLQAYSEQTEKDSSRIGSKYVFSDLNGVENGWGYENYFDHIIICYVTEDKTSLTIPSELSSLPVTELYNYCFTSCEDLQTVVLPKTIQKIDPFCFYECTSLRSVSLPSSLNYIGAGAFSGCTALESIPLSGDNPSFAVKNGVLFDKHFQELIQYPCGKKDTEYTVPDTVSSIRESAFLGTKYLRSVTIPESVMDINDGAFQDCAGLTDIYILNSACNIRDSWDDGQGYTINNWSENDAETGNTVFYFDGTIHGYEGSTAEDYAHVHHRNFAPIPIETTTTTITTTTTTTRPFVAYDTAPNALRDCKIENLIAGGRFECNAGDEIEFPINVFNCAGFAGGGMNIHLDSAIQPVLNKGELITEKEGIGQLDSVFLYNSEKHLIGIGMMGSKNARTSNSELYTIKLKIPDDVKAGTIYPISIEVDEWFDKNRHDIPVNIYDGLIHFNDGSAYQPTDLEVKTAMGIEHNPSPEALIPVEYNKNSKDNHGLGDVNSDGVIEISDATIILDFYVRAWLLQQSENAIYEDYLKHYISDEKTLNVIYDIMNVSRRTGRNATDPFENPPKVDAKDAMCVLEYYTAIMAGRGGTWESILGYDPYDISTETTLTTTAQVTTTHMTTSTTTTTTTTMTTVTTQTEPVIQNMIATDTPDARGIKVVRLFTFHYEPPTRVNYYSHDSRTFKESGGLKDQSSKVRISKYYVNSSNYYCDANGNPIGSYLFDVKGTVPSAVKPFEEIEKDITPYTHPIYNEDAPSKVWTNEIKAQLGDNYAPEQELMAVHAHKYILGAYYYPSEQSDSDLLIGTGEPICIGHFNVYIGVKGDYNLDNVVSAEDADLTEDYYTNYYVSMRRDTKLNDNPEFDGQDGLVYFLINVKYRYGYREDDPFEGPPKVDLTDAQLIRQFYTERYVHGSDCNWTDIVGYDIPGVSAELVTSTPAYTTTTTIATISTTTSTIVSTTTTSTVTTITTRPALKLNTNNIALTNGGQFTITANRNDVTFRSNNPDVAIVSQSGVVTAVGVGQAIISVYDAEANVVQVKVEVAPVTTTSTTTISSSTTLSEQPQSIAGDLNGDKTLSVADAVLLTRFISEAIPAEDIPPSDRINAADLDKDGLLTIMDVMLILRQILK